MLVALRTFFVTFIYGYTLVLCLFDAIMHNELYEYEWFGLRSYFHIRLTCLNLFVIWYVRFLCYYCVNYMATLKSIICCWLYVASIVLGTLFCRLPESILCNSVTLKDLRHRSVLFFCDIKDKNDFWKSAFYYHILYWESVSQKHIFCVHFIGICKMMFVLERV